VPRLCELYPGICLTTEEKVRKNVRVEKNLNQGRKPSVRVDKNLSQGRKTSVRVEKNLGQGRKKPQSG
jgi:hypothetical protein